MTFGESMRALMAERGISLRKLAALIPADPGHLSRISRDLKPPSKEMAERIDAALDADGRLTALGNVRDARSGQFTPDDEDRLIQAVRRPSRIDPMVVGSLRTILAEQRRLEDGIGSAPVLNVVKSQVRTISGLVAEARGPIRPQVVDVAAQWSQFAGWLSIAVGDPSAARTSLDRAAEHAEEIGDRSMIGTVLSWKAHLAERLGQVGPMIGMAHAAQELRLGPGRAYDLFLEARGQAMAGAQQIAVRLLGEAQATVADADPASARPWEYYYLEPGFFTLETGLTRIYLGRDDPRENIRAVECLATGLAALPVEMRGSEWAGEYIAHQAVAYLQTGDAEAACAAITEAADAAHATSSAALFRKLKGIHTKLRAKWPDNPAVAELRDVLC